MNHFEFDVQDDLNLQYLLKGITNRACYIFLWLVHRDLSLHREYLQNYEYQF